MSAVQHWHDAPLVGDVILRVGAERANARKVTAVHPDSVVTVGTDGRPPRRSAIQRANLRRYMLVQAGPGDRS